LPREIANQTQEPGKDYLGPGAEKLHRPDTQYRSSEPTALHVTAYFVRPILLQA